MRTLLQIFPPPSFTGEGDREAVEGAHAAHHSFPPPSRCARHLPRERGRKEAQ